MIVHDIMRKPNSIIVLLYIFHMIHPQKQKRSVQPFCFRGEHSKGLSNQADVELDMINAISASDIAFIMSSSQAIEQGRLLSDWLIFFPSTQTLLEHALPKILKTKMASERAISCLTWFIACSRVSGKCWRFFTLSSFSEWQENVG